MSEQKNYTGDSIQDLPIDDSKPSHEEVHIVDNMFEEQKGKFFYIFTELKESIIVAALFILFSLPPIDKLFQTIIPITGKSNYILIILKALIIGILFWIIKYFFLSRKQKKD